MATKLVDSEDIGASFSTSMSGLLASVSMARIAIESRDRIITDLQIKLAGQEKTIADLQAKLDSRDKTISDLQVKNENLSSYLTLLNETLEFLISKDLPVNSSKYKALNQSFQVDCVICNDQRLVLWKLLPVSSKPTTAPTDELLVRVMKHFAGKGTPSFGSVTARVDSIDVGADANSELGKRRRLSEAEESSKSLTKVTGITTDNRTIAPSAAAPAVVTAKSHSTASSVTSPSNSAAKYSISAFTAVGGVASSSLPTAPVVSTTATNTATAAATVTATTASTVWPNKPTVAAKSTNSTVGSTVRALPLPVTNRATNAASVPPPKATIYPSIQTTAKPGAVVTKPPASDVPGPAGPLSRLDTAVAVSSVFNLQSGTKQMAQWLRESQQATQNASANLPSGPSVTATLGTAGTAPAQKKRQSSVQPLPLSDLLRVASSSKTPVVLDLTTNGSKSGAASTTSGPDVVTPAVAANISEKATQLTEARTMPPLPLTQSLPVPTPTKTTKEPTTTTKNAPKTSTTGSGTNNAQGPVSNINAENGTADSSTSSSTANNHSIPESDSDTVVDPTIGTITVLPSSKPAQPWHSSTDNNLRPLIIKSMIMKHKDYQLRKHEPAWVASRRKGCEIFEAMQYYNCSSREEYMTQAGVNVC